MNSYPADILKCLKIFTRTCYINCKNIFEVSCPTNVCYIAARKNVWTNLHEMFHFKMYCLVNKNFVTEKQYKKFMTVKFKFMFIRFSLDGWKTVLSAVVIFYESNTMQIQFLRSQIISDILHMFQVLLPHTSINVKTVKNCP